MSTSTSRRRVAISAALAFSTGIALVGCAGDPVQAAASSEHSAGVVPMS